MRLHHLSVTAFGPFVDTAEVDFDALSDAGLFLLSGETGAGKSSILDAVCFAWYGAVPGDRQQAGRLRSDRAPADVAPRVTLEASVAGRRFRIVRSPAWERPKKRGTGTTREQARVTVSERVDAEWVPLTSRLDEAGDLLSGLLGMNLDQFCQVALLPQGRFQAFLRADSAQRQQLLARLFRTGRFERVEAWLRDHRLTLRRGSETHRAAVADLVSRVSEAATVAVPEHLADLAEAAGDGSLHAWLGELRETAATRETEGRRATAEAAELARESEAELTEARSLAAGRALVVEAAATLDRLSATARDHEAERDRLEQARRAESLRPLAELVDHRAVTREAAARRGALSLEAADTDVRDLAPQLDLVATELAGLTALLPAEARLRELAEEQEGAAETRRSLLVAAELEAAEAETLAPLVAELESEVASAAAAGEQVAELDAEAAQLRDLARAHTDARRLHAELTRAQVDRGQMAARLLDLREELLDLRERRIAGMAAELAGALVAGDDCPVCGSADHPHPARAGSGHPDAEAERRAQRLVDDAQADVHARDLHVRELEQSLAAARATLGETDLASVRERLAVLTAEQTELGRRAAARTELDRRLAATRVRIAALEDAAVERRVRLAEVEAALVHLRAETRRLEARVAQARGDHPALSSAVDALETRLAVLRTAQRDAAAAQAAAQALAEAEVALGRAATEAGFDTVDAARASELGPDALADLERSVREHQSALAAARAVLAEPGAEALVSTAPPDLATLETAHRGATETLERARAVFELAERRHRRIGALVDELDRALTLWAPVREELAVATRVSAFAEGKAPDNRLQMRLSAYVLAYRLSQVVAAANTRLTRMSDQRYSLEHVARRGAGETRGGLSLVVRDDWSGESRDPATLSGGETFVVSLALALGLADVVAHEAGGAELTTLFVDEGFGALDAETLDGVLDILDTLRENGRAVGVVSHVAEMGDRIPAQLVVTKHRAGSGVRVVC